MSEIGGVITAMVTPFDQSGEVDEAAARSLARRLIDSGSHGLVVAGTTGESPTLSDEEKLSLLRAVVDEVGSEATMSEYLDQLTGELARRILHKQRCTPSEERVHSGARR